MRSSPRSSESATPVITPPGEADATAGRDDAHVRAMTVLPGQRYCWPRGGPATRACRTVLCWSGHGGRCLRDPPGDRGGRLGTPPSGEARLVIGHESLGEVLGRRRIRLRARRSVRRNRRRPDPCRAPHVPPASRHGAGPTASASAASSACMGTEANTGGWSLTSPAHPPRLGELGVLLEPAIVLAGVGPGGPDLAARILPARPGRWVTAPGRSG